MQGVFYRDTVRRAAAQHGVTGSAVNLPDGNVECHLEGAQAAVDAVIAAARAGSPASQVESLEVEWLPAAGLSGFRVG